MKKALSIILAVMMLLAAVPMASFAEEPQTISFVDIGTVEPKAGEDLLNDFICNTDNVTVTAVKWFDVAAGDFEDEITFTANNEYIVYAYAEADEGFVFDGTTEAVINHNDAKVTVKNEGKELVAVITFYCEAPVVPTEIDEVVINFIYPVYGEPAFSDFSMESADCDVKKAHWFEASSDKFIDDSTNFTEGTYYIEVTFEPSNGNTFSKDVKVIINDIDAMSIVVNEDGTVTAVGQFEVEKEPSVLSGFAKFFAGIKTIFLTIIRFFGEMIGLK